LLRLSIYIKLTAPSTTISARGSELDKKNLVPIVIRDLIRILPTFFPSEFRCCSEAFGPCNSWLIKMAEIRQDSGFPYDPGRTGQIDVDTRCPKLASARTTASLNTPAAPSGTIPINVALVSRSTWTARMQDRCAYIGSGPAKLQTTICGF
jgi:hypothetical protein